MTTTIRIGTRRSKLALIQTSLVIKQIELHFPHIKCQIIPITTSGDIIQHKPLYEIGGKALFLKEIEQQLLENKIDIAVHSLKDVPGRTREGLVIAAVLEREDPREVFVCLNYNSIHNLPLNATVGTSAVRRKLFLKTMRSDLQIVGLRGNVDSRIQKIINSEVCGTVLSYAGLKRLNLFDKRYCYMMHQSEMLPCIGQGVVAVEVQQNDQEMLNICSRINHIPTFELIRPERAFLEYLDANCNTPIAACSTYLPDGNIKTDFMLSNPAGTRVVFHSQVTSIKNSIMSGVDAAKIMIKKLSL